MCDLRFCTRYVSGHRIRCNDDTMTYSKMYKKLEFGFLCLPTKVGLKIVSYLNQQDVLACSKVCKLWMQFFSSILNNHKPIYMSKTAGVFKCPFYHGTLSEKEVLKIAFSDCALNSIFLFSSRKGIYYGKRDMRNPANLELKYYSVKVIHQSTTEKIILITRLSRTFEPLCCRSTHQILTKDLTISPNHCKQCHLLCQMAFENSSPTNRSNPFSLFDLSRAVIANNFTYQYLTKNNLPTRFIENLREFMVTEPPTNLRCTKMCEMLIIDRNGQLKFPYPHALEGLFSVTKYLNVDHFIHGLKNYNPA